MGWDSGVSYSMEKLEQPHPMGFKSWMRLAIRDKLGVELSGTLQYLGVPITSCRMRRAEFMKVEQSIQERLEGW